MMPLSDLQRQGLDYRMKKAGLKDSDILVDLPERLLKVGHYVRYSGNDNIIIPHPICWIAANQIDELMTLLALSRLNGAWDEHPDCERVDELLAPTTTPPPYATS